MVDETLKSRALPDNFADAVVRIVASDEDLEAAKGFLVGSYHGKRKAEMFGSIEAAQSHNIYIVTQEGTVESAGFYDETVLSIGSTPVKAVRSREMCDEAAVPGVEPRFENFVKGYQGCFQMAKERGVHIAVIHGSQYDHAHCGFVPSFYYPVATLPTEVALSVESAAIIGDPDPALDEEARNAFRTDPYVPRITAGMGMDSNVPPAAVVRDGRTEGYLRPGTDCDPKNPWGTDVGFLADITLRTREAARAVIRLAGGMAKAKGGDEICLMYSHMTPLTQAIISLGGKYVLRPPCDLPGLDAEMVAIIDLPGLAKDIEAEFQARFTASGVRGDKAAFSIEMAKQVASFSAEGGELKIAARKQKVHRVVPRWVVTRLVMGFYSGDDVLTMGPLPCDRADGKTPDDPKLDMNELELPEPEAAVFRALFPKMWPTAMPDPDVWPWVIGKPHPRYQHEEAKTPEMRAAIDALRFPWFGR